MSHAPLRWTGRVLLRRTAAVVPNWKGDEKWENQRDEESLKMLRHILGHDLHKPSTEIRNISTGPSLWVGQALEFARCHELQTQRFLMEGHFNANRKMPTLYMPLRCVSSINNHFRCRPPQKKTHIMAPLFLKRCPLTLAPDAEVVAAPCVAPTQLQTQLGLKNNSKTGWVYS